LFSTIQCRSIDSKNSACAGDAYPCTVTMHEIRLHLDTVQKAFYTDSTGPYLKPT
jgi:hypothetical protein